MTEKHSSQEPHTTLVTASLRPVSYTHLTDEYTDKIRSALSEVSDISDVGMPDSNGVFDLSLIHISG